MCSGEAQPGECGHFPRDLPQLYFSGISESEVSNWLIFSRITNQFSKN
jgi:hypothetical protein